jgi:O-antigen/teichoic acid export membrane protein
MINRAAISAQIRPWVTFVTQPPSRRGFAANVASMLTGTVLGQAASLALSPVLTRIYGPEQFGFLSVYTAALTILGVIAAMGFELAIPLAESRSELANLLASSATALIATTALVALAAWKMPDGVLDFLWLGLLAPYRWLVPIGFACLGCYSVLVAVATRLEAFREIASTRLSQGLSGPLSQIALGMIGAGTPGLAAGYVIGQSSGTLLLFSRVVARSPGLLADISLDGMRAVVRRYARFPLIASWTRLIDMAGGGPILFLLYAACYSSEIAGYLFLAERVIMRPLLMVSTSLLQVFVGEAGQSVRQDPARLRRRFRQVTLLQFLLSGSWILAADVLSYWAFPVLFGEQWSNAVPYLCASSIGYLGLAVLHPVSTSLQLMQRQFLAALWQTGRLIIVVGGVVVAWRLGFSALTALWIASVAQAIACVVMLALIAVSIERIQPQ